MNPHHPADILHEYHVRFYDSTISLVPYFKEGSHDQPSKPSEKIYFFYSKLCAHIYGVAGS
jgi:hypothetical protein